MAEAVRKMPTTKAGIRADMGRRRLVLEADTGWNGKGWKLLVLRGSSPKKGPQLLRVR